MTGLSQDAATAEARPGRVRKSSQAFRTISEVSRALNVSQHVLRFWETKFSQIKPLKRSGRRRYYRPEDVVLLRGVRDLLYVDGYTIRGVQKLLREGGVRVLQQRADGPLPPALSAEPPDTAPQENDDSDPRRAALADILRELEAMRRLLDEVT